jgi:hypothetical protein
VIDMANDKIRRQKDLIKRTVDRFKETTSVDYAKYFEGSPTYITYYQLDDIATRQDEALENVHSLIGRSSPNKYKKIHDVVIYGVDALSISNEINDRGLESLISGDFVLLPDSIRPYPGDFFVFDEEDLGTHLFRINDVQYDRASPKKFFRCAFSLYPDNSELIFENVLKDESGNEVGYVLDYQTTSGENYAVIKKSDAATADKIKLLTDSIISRFRTLFYDEDMDTFVAKIDSFQTRVIINTDSKDIQEGESVYLVSTLNGYDGVRVITDSLTQTSLGTAITKIPKGDFGRIQTANSTLANIWSPYLQKFISENDILSKYEEKFMDEIFINDMREAYNPKLFSDQAYHNGIYSKVLRQLPLTLENSFINYDQIYDLKSTRNLPFFHGTQEYASLLLHKDVISWYHNFHILFQTPSDIFLNYPAELKFNSYDDVPDDLADGTIIYKLNSNNMPENILMIKTVDGEKTAVGISFSENVDIDGELIYNIIRKYLITDKTADDYLIINEDLILEINNYLITPSIKDYMLLPILIYILKEKVLSYTS